MGEPFCRYPPAVEIYLKIYIKNILSNKLNRWLRMYILKNKCEKYAIVFVTG